MCFKSMSRMLVYMASFSSPLSAHDGPSRASARTKRTMAGRIWAERSLYMPPPSCSSNQLRKVPACIPLPRSLYAPMAPPGPVICGSSKPRSWHMRENSRASCPTTLRTSSSSSSLVVGGGFFSGGGGISDWPPSSSPAPPSSCAAAPPPGAFGKDFISLGQSLERGRSSFTVPFKYILASAKGFPGKSPTSATCDKNTRNDTSGPPGTGSFNLRKSTNPWA
mmetsp:Transcript_121158/g.342806  ORF Transcript_121158/g.342806 Transcript_121158/m.342806 type:complete len:222 (-) Transcript_121158:1237-1902(-)